ncbi:DUF6531 domain-containing protein [Sorangium sp. So ce1335]|uniref:DUF6531 domain-containing protein n=1 Tax=Sorangium sp. So ce1335 TaxID=3133335 RepID=UPI003F5D8FB3
MATTSSDKEIATTGSGHVMPGPTPAVSHGPALTPAGAPVPTPYVYMARSATAEGTESCTTISDKPLLTLRSHMKIDEPGNMPSKSTGGDVVTFATCGRATMFTASSAFFAGELNVCRTLDKGYMNTATADGKVAQCLGTLFHGVDVSASGADPETFSAKNRYVIDPVSVASGEVCDDDVDAVLEGRIRVVWRRLYASGRNRERTPLGRGGWTHSFHQWIELADDHLLLRDAGGRSVRLPPVPEKGSSFHRGKRLTVTRKARTIEVFEIDARLTRVFRSDGDSGRAMLQALRDPSGNVVELVYEGGRLVKIVGTSGRELRLAHDGEGRIVRLDVWAAGAPRRTVSYAYSEHGDLERYTDALGHTTRYDYDGHHRLVAKTLPTGLGFHYEYDASGRCVRGHGDGGIHAADLAYDTSKGETTVTGNPAPRVFQWDARGAVTLQRTSDGAVVQRTEYDDDLLVVAEENAAGERHRYEHDARGNLVAHTDAGGRITRREFRDDRMVKRILPDGRVTEFAYDDRGALIEVTYPSGLTLSLDHDGRGRISALRDPDGLHVSFEYDEQDNLVVESGATGDRTRYTYDALGSLTSITDALGRTTRISYDAGGRVTAIQRPDGSTVRREYDPLGRLVRETDPAGAVFTSEHGGTHSLRRTVGPDGQVWEAEYDTLERVRAIRNPRREVWEYRYDRAGRVIEQRTFDGRILRYRWSRSDHLARIEHMDGTYRAFETDAHGALRIERSPHGALTFETSGSKLVGTVDEATGKTVVESEFDALGRLVAETQDGLTIHYGYDERNRRAVRVLPTGETTRYRYDGAGALIAVEHEGRIVSIVRDVLGNEVRRHLHTSGVDILTSTDVMDRIARQRVLAPARAPGAPRATLLDRAFRYDVRGYLQTVDDSLRGTTRYEHDVSGRLVEARRGERREIIDYDAAGSVVGMRAEPEQGIPWAMRPGNVLIRAGDVEYEHDEGRRRVRQRRGGAVTELLWDCRDRLREVRLPGGTRVLYTYDAHGRRVRKEILPPPADPPAAPRVVRYLWDGLALAAEIDSERGTRVFVHVPGSLAPLLHQEQGEVFAYINDHLGAPRELVDERGEIAWAGVCSAWGAEVARVTPSGRARPPETPFRLLGHYHDEETGFSHTLYRYFDPTTARWLSPDPLGLPGGANPAAFNGSPVVHVDALGLQCVLGNPAWDVALSRAMAERVPEPGYYDVIVHGTPHFVASPLVRVDFERAKGGEVIILGAERLAAVIKRLPDYKGQKIRLISCSTGAADDGVAADLAKLLNTEVQAPRRDIDAVEVNDGSWLFRTFDPTGPRDPWPPKPAMVVTPPATVTPGAVDGGPPVVTPRGTEPVPPAMVTPRPAEGFPVTPPGTEPVPPAMVTPRPAEGLPVTPPGTEPVPPAMVTPRPAEGFPVTPPGTEPVPPAMVTPRPAEGLPVTPPGTEPQRPAMVTPRPAEGFPVTPPGTEPQRPAMVTSPPRGWPDIPPVR